MIDRILSWMYIRKIWGSRCSGFMYGCASCRKWAEHDWLFNGPWKEHGKHSIHKMSELIEEENKEQFPHLYKNSRP